jgi:tripartite-type tricarboxylate transporter receptor subunit TctC
MTKTKPLKSAIVLAFSLALCSFGAAPQAAADSWPSRPVTLVVAFAAGGGTDAVARIFARGLSEVLNQQVIIENVPGAGGMMGTSRVAKSPPDGYQVAFAGSADAIDQSLYKRPLYNLMADFIPVVLLAEQPTVLVVPKNSPANTLQEFIAYAKQHQGKLKFGATVGSTGHLDCAQFNSTTGIEATLVPYRGGGLTMPDLIAGRTDYVCTLSATAKPQIEGHLVKTMAIFTLKRSPILPDVPTADEQGLKNFETTTWFGLMVPKGTPAEVVQKLHDASVAALDKPAVQDGLKQVGASAVAANRRSPEYLRNFAAEEIKKKAEIIKAAGLTAE